MKMLLALLGIWCVIVTLYAMGVSIGLGEEVERRDKTVKYLQDRLAELSRTAHEQEKAIAEAKALVHDPHFKAVGFCSECKNGTYSKTLGCYLYGGLEKTEFEFCSDFEGKDES